jgi:hypothetical protein
MRGGVGGEFDGSVTGAAIGMCADDAGVTGTGTGRAAGAG